MVKQERRYISYLLRLWQGTSGGELVWLASLESPRTGERRGFARLDDLLDFLQHQTDALADATESNSRTNEADHGHMTERLD